jgi:GNAT superfamily N-acetyltransferase
MTAIEIFPVQTPEQFEQFFAVPLQVYRDDPHWVRPLDSGVRKQFSLENAFLTYGEMQPFVAIKDGEPVGRIVPSINRRLIEREGEQIGLFGFFEVIEDDDVAAQLFTAAEQWLRDRAITRIRGPIDFSTHNSCLFLADGFTDAPHILTPYNPPYYIDLMTKLGWETAKDAYAYTMDLSKPLDSRFERSYQIALKSGITFRNLHTKGEAFEQDCRTLYDLFTTMFANNWSSSPRTWDEFWDEAQDLKTLVDPDIFPVAEDQGKMIGFCMALPDYNIALKQVNGKLNGLGILKFLWFRRQIDRARVIAITALPEYRRKAVPLALVHLLMEQGTKPGKPYQTAEHSFVWEDNHPSRHLIEVTGSTIAKTYRIFEKAIA